MQESTDVALEEHEQLSGWGGREEEKRIKKRGGKREKKGRNCTGCVLEETG